MPNPSKFTHACKQKIIHAFRQGGTLAKVAKVADISRQTLYHWLERGEWETEGEYHTFYRACKNAQETYQEVMQEKLEKVIYTRATETITTITTMTTTTTTDIEGNTTETVVVKEHLPNARLALEILARRNPEKWNKVAMLKQQQDVREQMRAKGLDAEKVMSKLQTVLAKEIADADGDVRD